MKVFLIILCALVPLQQALAIRGDYTGDGKAELVVASVNKTSKTTTFQVLDLSNSQTTSYTVNAQGDALVPADYDGDGVTDPAVVYVTADANLEWHTLINSVESSENFGVNGDTPLTGDVDCDGKSDRIVARKGSDDRYYWYFELSGGSTVSAVKYGRAGDQLFVSDVAAGGCDELVLARANGSKYDWYYRTLSDANFTTLSWGLVTDRLIAPADVNGDGVADFIYVRSSGKTATGVARTADGVSQSFSAGASTDVVLSGKFSGGIADEVGTYRRAKGSGSSSFSLQLTGGTSTVDFGTRTSILVRPDGTVVQYGEGAGSSCGNVVSIDSLVHVLYKASNLHGGRGPTFLVQNPAERTNKRKIIIKDVNCKSISSFGLYRTDFPFGSRYYEGSGGSHHSARQLLRLAQKAGSTAILVEGVDKWIRVDNPLNRQGNIAK